MWPWAELKDGQWVQWPWAEANQGLLSLLALVSALAVALFEQRRANEAGEQRIREFGELIAGVVEGVASDTLRLAEVMAAQPLGSVVPGLLDWGDKLRSHRELIAQLRPTCPPDATLARLVMDLDAKLNVQPGIGFMQDPPGMAVVYRRHAESWVTAAAEIRARSRGHHPVRAWIGGFFAKLPSWGRGTQ